MVKASAGFSNLGVSGTTSISTLKGRPASNYLKFVTGEYFGLNVVAKADGDVDTGFTMSPNTLYESAWDGTNAAASMVLPKAVPNTLVVWRQSAAADRGQNIVFTCGSGDTYNAHNIHLPAIGGADVVANRGPRCLPIAALGTATNTIAIAAANNTLTVASTSTNNQTNLGSEFIWYCDTAGKWLFGFVPSFLGTGVINATFTFSTA